jgi:hypothetical protein
MGHIHPLPAPNDHLHWILYPAADSLCAVHDSYCAIQTATHLISTGLPAIRNELYFPGFPQFLKPVAEWYLLYDIAASFQTLTNS